MFSARVHAGSAVLLALALGLSGSGLTVGCAAPGDSVAAGDLAGLELTFDDDIPTVLHVSWPSDEGARSWVEYGLTDTLGLSTPSAETVDGATELAVLGLKAGRSYSLQALSELSDGTVLQSEVQTVDVAQRAAGLPSVDLVVPATARAQPGGYLAFAIMQPDAAWIAIIDRDGDYVWWHEVGERMLAPTIKLARNGTDLLFGSYDIVQVEDVGQIQRIALRGGRLDTTRTVMAHHSFAELPDGTFAWLAFDSGDFVVDGQHSRVTGDRIDVTVEGATESTAVHTVRSLLDDWHAPAITCSHQAQIVEGTGGLDWTHSNSLVYRESDDAFYLMARHLDALLKIDASTGDILAEMSPWSNDVRGDPHTMWDHPHFSQVLDDGIMVFDNRDHDPSPVSGVSRYAIDYDRGTYERTWHYDDPDGNAMEVLGDARLLPGGTYLTAWMALGTLVELTENGDIAWKVGMDLGSAVGRLQWIADLYDLNVTE